LLPASLDARGPALRRGAERFSRSRPAVQVRTGEHHWLAVPGSVTRCATIWHYNYAIDPAHGQHLFRLRPGASRLTEGWRDLDGRWGAEQCRCARRILFPAKAMYRGAIVGAARHLRLSRRGSSVRFI